jgi:hypothetical protein
MITGDSDSTAIATFNGVPLSMGDCSIKLTPGKVFNTFQVTGQFVGYDSTSPIGISQDMRKTAEQYLKTVVDACGGLAVTLEIKGPKGAILIGSADSVLADLYNPFTNLTYEDVYLTAIDGGDNGGKSFPVTYTFQQPIVVSGDGTAASQAVFNGIDIGNRGGTVKVGARNSTLEASVVSYYVGANPLTYFAGLANSLGFSPSYRRDQPRGAAGNRSSVASYDAITSTLSCGSLGSLTDMIINSMDFDEQAPGIFVINTNLTAKR